MFNLHPRLDLIMSYLSFINITTNAEKCSYIQDSGTNHSNRVHFKKKLFIYYSYVNNIINNPGCFNRLFHIILLPVIHNHLASAFFKSTFRKNGS